MAAEDDTLHALITLHDGQLSRLKQLDAYYEGTQPLSYMHPELIQALEGQVRQVVINWPQMVVDSIEERLDIEGFRRPDKASGDAQIWEIWEANDMDAGSQRTHVEALALGRAYVTVGAGDKPDDPPVITDESALDMIAISDPRTRETSAALRRWSSTGVEQPAAQADSATLYLPDATLTYAKQKDGSWKVDKTDQHNLGAVPVVPILNRARRKQALGVSELNLVISLSDAACKIATDMMVGANFHALPRYYATGVAESDFVDDQGNPISVWKQVTGRIYASENKDAQIGVLAASDLANFHKTLVALAQLVASLCGLPPHYLGFSTDNPASAEGIKSSEARLVKRCERKTGMFDVGWEEVMRIAMRLETGAWDPDLKRLMTDWRDPSTPTEAQVADAVVKTYQAGIIPLKYARRKLRYSDPEISQMEEMDAQDALQLKVPTAGELLQLRDPQPTPPGAPTAPALADAVA